MAVKQYFFGGVSLYGDGVSTQSIVDLNSFGHPTTTGYVLDHTPSVTIGSDTYTSTAFIVGNILVLTWSAPIPAGIQGGAQLLIGY